MNTSRTRWPGVLLARYVAGVSIAVAGFAAESAAPSDAAQGDAIKAARREFETMKAVGDRAQQPNGSLPKMTMPELQQSASDPRPWASPKSKQGHPSTKKSSNWLVEAMEKEARRNNDRSGSRDGRGREEAENVDEAAGAFDPTPENEEELSALAAERVMREREITEQREKREVVNPLTRFLGDWMTPRDYAVLKPALDDAATGRSNGRTDQSSPALLGIDASVTETTLGIGSAGESSRLMPIVPRENPYLEGLQTPPPTIPTPQLFAPPSVRAVAPTPAPMVSPAAAPTSAPKSKIPEFAKPAQDEKYFKQLKRF